MTKEAKKFQQKYADIMGQSDEDELWNRVKNGIDDFKKKIERGEADGYFWNMYFNLLRENRLLFTGLNNCVI